MKKNGALQTQDTTFKTEAHNNEVSDRVEDALRTIKRPQSKRVLVYVASNQDCYTHRLASACAVSNVSDAVADMRSDLNRVGLKLYCYSPEEKLTNRFGEKSLVHKWRLNSLDQG